MYFKITSGIYKDNLDQLFTRVDETKRIINEFIKAIPGTAGIFLGNSLYCIACDGLAFTEDPGKDWKLIYEDSEKFYRPKKNRKSVREILRQLETLPRIPKSDINVALGIESNIFTTAGVAKISSGYVIKLPTEKVYEAFRVIDGVSEITYSEYREANL